MLVRKQILLEEKQVLELENLSRLTGMSVSKLVRRAIPCGVEKEKMKAKKISKSLKSQYKAFDKWIAGAVKGPGDSEYDKYAYDL
jgi:hypothetical protein